MTSIITPDTTGGDVITVGNISESYAAIGAGAQVLVTQINQALSAIDEMEKSIRAAEQQLAEAIHRRIEEYTHLAGTSAADERRNPYKSLLEYKVEDTPYFYGRNEAIAAMLERLRRSRLTILESESGAGKTSLLQAGLASRLIAGGDFALYVRPYDLAPEKAIKRAFLPDYESRQDLARFREGSMGLFGFLERVCHYLGDRELVIFLDQFEEFFNKLPAADQQAFAAQLRECVESALPVRWVLAMRKEYLSELRLFEGLKPFDNRYFLPAFSVEEAYDVLVEPALLKGVAYEDGLVQQIVSDIGQHAAAITPVQLQLVCYTLFEETAGQRDPGLITHALYEKRRGRGEGKPGAEGILTSHLTRVLDSQLSGRQRRLAVTVLEALVTYDGRRDIKSFNTLAAETETAEPHDLGEVLQILVDNRLLRSGRDENDEYTYELAHDYLLREIEVDPDAQARKLAQEILNQEVEAWLANQALRIPYDKLAMLEAQQPHLYLDQNAVTLLDLSRRARRQQQLKVLGSLLFGSLVIVAIAFVAIDGGIQRLVYRPPDPDMIPIPAGEFVMGSSIEDQQRSFAADAGDPPDVAALEFSPAGSSEASSGGLVIEEVRVNDAGRARFLKDERPLHDVYVDAFEIDRNEVINRDYLQCVRSTACSRPANTTFDDPAYANYPVTDVNHGQAANYCSWRRGRLPTEAEWERAARFDYDKPGQLYAWGDVADPSLANLLHEDAGMPAPVGSFLDGNTKADLVDMTGNVAEWVSDWYAEDYYRVLPEYRNPTGPETGKLRIVRGGSFASKWVEARITYRDASLHDGYPSPQVGFRCVR